MTDTANIPTATDGGLPGNGHIFEVGNYAPVADELTEYDLPVERRHPGRTRRLVPAQRTQPAAGASGHWFTGDGMIHGVRIEGGRPSGTATGGCAPTASPRPFPLYNGDGTRNLRAGRRQHPRRPPRGQDPRPGRNVAAL